MNPGEQTHPQECDVFLQALDFENETELDHFLTSACSGDDHLRKRVEALLNCNRQSTGDMEPPEPWVAEALQKYKSIAETRAVPGSPDSSSPSQQKGWTPPAASAVDLLIDGYEVEEMIGRGGMGAVYRGRQTSLQRSVAIKILPPEYGEAPGFADRFEREALAMAKMNHPNIVTIYDFGSAEFVPRSESESPTGKLLYFVMEYVDGTDLQQLIQSGNLEAGVALSLIAQICDALQYAHGKGFIHRDIKPANIFITREGSVKVGDFGLAKLAGIGTDDSSNLTIAGQIVGTPHYLAPETLTGNGIVDHRADIFSLGVMFYQMLTGTLPKGSFPTPSEKAHVDVRLDQIVLKAMQSEPDQRYQQASEIKEDITEISSGIAPPDSVPAGKIAESSIEERAEKSKGPTKVSSSPRRAWIFTIATGLIGIVCAWYILKDSAIFSSTKISGQNGINLMTAEKWKREGDVRWMSNSGDIHAVGESTGSLQIKLPFQEFHLTGEVKADPDAIGGIGFWASEFDESGHAKGGYLFHVSGSRGSDFPTGSLMTDSLLSANRESQFTDNQWTTFQVKASRGSIRGFLDGNATFVFPPLPDNRRIRGDFLYLGQSSKRGRISFRNLQISPLKN